MDSPAEEFEVSNEILPISDEDIIEIRNHKNKKSSASKEHLIDIFIVQTCLCLFWLTTAAVGNLIIPGFAQKMAECFKRYSNMPEAEIFGFIIKSVNDFIK